MIHNAIQYMIQKNQKSIHDMIHVLTTSHLHIKIKKERKKPES